MKLFLFHDEEALRWTPFVETRPVGELLFGTRLLRERAARALGAASVAYLGAPHLAGFDEPGAPPHLDAPDAEREDRVFLSVRAAIERPPQPLHPGPATLLVEGRAAGWIVPSGSPAPSPAQLARPEAGEEPAVLLGGQLLGRPWHLMTANAERIAADVQADHPGSDAFQLSDVHVVGEHRVLLGPGAEVEPGVVLDVRSGPVLLAARARVEGPARVTGPFYLGEDSTVLGGSVGTSSIGPVCKVRGEVAHSVFVGYSNKGHDGHVGHALLGRWVNLGAGTINSDLKNTYSSVRLRLPEGEVDTGLMKCGSFLGDHVKTGIGTLLTTGAVIGAATNVFGGRMPPQHVPPFSWGEGDQLVEYQVDRFLATAEIAMHRRGVELSAGMRQVLTGAAERARAQRERGTRAR